MTLTKRQPRKDRSEEFSSHKAPSAADLWRHDGKARATVVVPKDAPLRSEAYRRLVAALPCCDCGIEGHSQCAHGPTLGKSIKCDDRLTFPLCADAPDQMGCHTFFDRYVAGRQNRALLATQYAKQTREQIKAAGQWPANLPTWSEE